VHEHRRSLTYQTFSGMAWVAWGSGAIAVLKMAVLVLLTRLLSPADFGVVGAALIVISFSLTFSQLGLGQALVQRPVLEPRHITTAYWVSAALGFLVAALIWLAAPVVAGFFRMDHLAPVVRWLALVFPMAGISTVPESLLKRELRFRVLANRDVVSYGVGYGAVGVGLALLDWGVWALVGAQLMQMLIRTVILQWAAPPIPRARPSAEAFRELMDYGVGQSAAALAVMGANQADNVVVGRWLGPVALGLYGRAFQLMSVPTALLGDVFDKVLFPALSRLQDDSRRLGTAYLQGIACISLLTLPAGVVAAILAPEIVRVAFGSRWDAVVAPFQVLALGTMFRTSSRMSDSLTRATGKVYRRAWRQGLYAGLVFAAALVGQRWGITGVAAGVLAALATNYLLMAQLSLNVSRISWLDFFKAQMPAVGQTVLLAAVTFAVKTETERLALPPLARLVAGLAAAGAVAILAAWLVPTLALGEYGIRTRTALRAHLATLSRPAPTRNP
jgi:O-antigen/teichoic acid export membrane protein